MNDSPSSSGGLSTALVGAIAVVIAAVIGAAGGFAAAYYGFLSKDQELKVHLVEIAVGILRADPKEGVTPARAWALDIIEKNSGVPFSKEDREALLQKPLAGKLVGEYHLWTSTGTLVPRDSLQPSPEKPSGK
jgi:hypothetical protein